MDNTVLNFKDYNIGGNVLRAYYDADDKLVFVLDNTVDDRKPNALLVINPVGDRKWDDILANDYGVDLETVRPKKNNKYQKLDIEYSGLSEYDNLIQAYVADTDLTEALTDLAKFREDSVRRAAAERLAVAEQTAERARETIQKTHDAIEELQTKLRELRSKLNQQKRQIGREPTKKSASKILRTDAALDATNEKLRRAKKRLANAQRRLIVADTDATAAREILERETGSRGVTLVDDDKTKKINLPQQEKQVINATYNVSFNDEDDVSDDDTLDDDDNDMEIHYSAEVDAPKTLNVAAKASDENVARLPVDDENQESDEFTNTENTDEQKAENMADEKQNDKDEVKPLFDEDPQILDEEVAFKPIQFGVSSPVSESQDEQQNTELYDNVIDDKPLSFTPPVQEDSSEKDDYTEGLNSAPVLESMRAVNSEDEKLDSEVTGGMNAVPETPVSPQPETRPVQPEPYQRPVAQPESGAGTYSTAPTAETPRPMPTGDIGARPASPLVSNVVRPAAPVAQAVAGNSAPRKPTFLYYVLLILLIGLSVFTLWLYQKKTVDKTPDLSTDVGVQAETTETEVEKNADVDSPFIPEIVTPDTVVVAEPETVIEQESVVEDVVTEPEVQADAVIESFNLPVETVAEPAVVIETEEEILARKPAYNVSQNENMFIAAPDYDTETLPKNTGSTENVTTTSTVTAQEVQPVEQIEQQEEILAEKEAVSFIEPVVTTTTETTVTTTSTNSNANAGANNNQEYAVQSGTTLSEAVYSQTVQQPQTYQYNTANTVKKTTVVNEEKEFVPQSVTSMVWPQEVEEDLPVCPDGTAPDINGCCTGEIYTNMGEKGFNCCPETGGDCFPPLI